MEKIEAIDKLSVAIKSAKLHYQSLVLAKALIESLGEVPLALELFIKKYEVQNTRNL